jgi:hypothetical protein
VAARRRSVVPGQLDEVEVVVGADRAREIGDEEQARFQRPDEKRLAVAVVVGDLASELGDPGRDLRRGQVDVADPLVSR